MRLCFSYGKIILYYTLLVIKNRSLGPGSGWSESSGISNRSRIIKMSGHCPEIDMIRAMSMERLSLFI